VVVNEGVLLDLPITVTAFPKTWLTKFFNPSSLPNQPVNVQGLSLSYDIIKAHGGEIKSESKEGEGTTFIVRLPA
jgi:K+-sensing histidine kinase KdpD